MRKQVLVPYSSYEIQTNAKRSVPRLLASVISYLEKNVDITFFTFSNSYSDNSIQTQPVALTIPFQIKLARKIKNIFSKHKISTKESKRSTIFQWLKKQRNNYPVVLVLNIPDLLLAKKLFPQSSILFWFHDVTLIGSKYDVTVLNNATHVISPSTTTYKKFLDNAIPKALTAEFHYIPNWSDEVFNSGIAIEIQNKIKAQHSITASSKIIIFTGGDAKFKGGHIIKKAIQQLSMEVPDIVFFMAGTTKVTTEELPNNLKIISIGYLDPKTLAAYYSISHIGVFSSLGYEHSPLTLIEMISCGVLPVSSNIGGTVEILRDDYPFLVNIPQSVNEWQLQIKKAVGLSKDEWNKKIFSIQLLVNERYNKARSLKSFLNTLSQL